MARDRSESGGWGGEGSSRDFADRGYLQNVAPRAGVSVDRRDFLAVLGLGTAAVATKGIWDFIDHRREFGVTAMSVLDGLEKDRPLEKLPHGYLKPEDERDQGHFLTSMIPEYSAVPIVGGFDFDNKRTVSPNPALAALPKESDVGLLVPNGSENEAIEYATQKHPHLKFYTCGLPLAEDGYTYPQDVVWSTGRQDQDGRFVLAGSSIDPQEYRRDSSEFNDYRARLKFGRPVLSAENINDARMDEEGIQKAGIGMKHFGDEFLAAGHKDKFALKYAPVALEGGDLQITRLPDGKLALLVGKKNFSQTLMSLQRGGNFPENEIEARMFFDLTERAKSLYKEYCGVDEVILIDEPHIVKEAHRNRYIRHSGLRGYDFFHADMLVRTATTPAGEAVAFCSSNGRPANEGDESYTARVERQFRDLGYNVVPLKVGTVATMNYTNTVMFTDTNGIKMVLVPQYGIPEDGEARKSYEHHGFDVRVVDQSFVGWMPRKDAALIGGPHCKLVVLA